VVILVAEVPCWGVLVLRCGGVYEQTDTELYFFSFCKYHTVLIKVTFFESRTPRTKSFVYMGISFRNV